MTWREWLERLLRSLFDTLANPWRAPGIAIDNGDRGASPIGQFFREAIRQCQGRQFVRDNDPRLVVIAAQPAAGERPMFDGLQLFLAAATTALEEPGIRAGRDESVQTLQNLGRGHAGNVEVADFIRRCGDQPDAEAIRRLVHEKLDQCRTVSTITRVARQALQGVSPRRTEPEDVSWEPIVTSLAANPTWCSLIYSYWLDEGGLPWTLERLADRVENGLVRNTQPLAAVHVNEGPGLRDVLATFLSMWQRGELIAVDERRRQYAAVYGFPLYAAARLGGLETVDARSRFAGVFHQYLHEAMKFYRDRRNLEMVADPTAAQEAFSTLFDVLREGNENLRLRMPPELRGQLEYTKQALGGYVPGPLAAQWAGSLPGRPGVRDMVEPWQYATDAVATLYGWSRPGIRDYLTLAERGEAILVIVRALGPNPPNDSNGSTALLLSLQDSITRYVAAYKTVSGVDLEAQADSSPPAIHLAKRYPPPSVPPMRRNWAETPA